MDLKPEYRTVEARLHADSLWLEMAEAKVYGGSWGLQAWMLVTVTASPTRTIAAGGLVFVPVDQLAEALGWTAEAWTWFAPLDAVAV